MSLPAAILDIDGTLVDTNYQSAVAWYMAFPQHDVRLPVWRVHRHIGMGGDQLVAARAGEKVNAELGDAIRAAESALYLASIQTTSPLEGARDLIERLKDDGRHSVTVSSNAPKPPKLSRRTEPTPLRAVSPPRARRTRRTNTFCRFSCSARWLNVRSTGAAKSCWRACVS